MKRKNKKPSPVPSAGGESLLIYGLTIFAGAFLLFQVQPIIAKYILPWYGGSQAVWTVSLLFFQVFLLVGYLYAHLLGKLPTPRAQVRLHVTLLTVSLFLLPIIPDDSWKSGFSGDPTWKILGLLTATLGLPYLLLASTSPLLQSWLSRSRKKRSPYRFYALSNIGSMLALVTYPFLVEPNISRSAQAVTWSWIMGAFVFFTILSGMRFLRENRASAGHAEKGEKKVDPGSGAADSPVPEGGMVNPSQPVSTLPNLNVTTRLFWLLLPTAASVMLLATTTRLVQELVAIPFLWILPLTIYLLSFIITFDREKWYSRRVFLLLLIISFGGVLYFLLMKEDPPLLTSIVFYSAALFTGCMVCHGEVVRLKPPPARLTSFYLYLSAGGALGGVLVGIVAPALFSDYLEYDIVLVAVPLLWMLVYLYGKRGKTGRGEVRMVLTGSAAGILVLVYGLVQGRASRDANSIAHDRNFYGTLTVAEYGEPGEEYYHRVMRHGRILHGLQYLSPELAYLPTAYFTEHSGVGLTLLEFPRKERRKVGVVGLGVGTLAAWAGPTDTVRFYEINPAVESMAGAYFTYLKKCRGTVDVILGDGRLVLENERPQEFDILVLDAFNNDSPPLHLLTMESFETYFRHLKPDGAIAVNITSRFINFTPVIAALGDHFHYPWTTVPDFNREDEYNRTQSFWVILTRNPGLLSSRRIVEASNRPLIRGDIPLWTDDYTSLFRIVEW